MKKFLTFLMILLLSTASMMAQTIVGTDPENKNVILEEYTGIHCVYCPQGHAIAQAIYDANPEDVVLINIHEGAFSVPSGSEPDFRTQWGSAIAGEAGSSSVGWPSGSVNRHIYTGSQSAMSRSLWTSRSNQVLAETSYLNIELEATIVTSTRQLVVYVEVYYTGDSPEEKNYLNVAILQNDILGPQTGGGMGNNYVHKHMLRHLMTGQWGVEIDETTTGSFYSGTFTYDLPMDYNGVDVVLEDLDVVGFVTESHQEAISGNLAEMTVVDSYEYDAAFYSTYVPQTTCAGELNAQVMLKNYGTEALTSLDFTYSVNGEEPAEYVWTGSLNQFDSELVTLPEYIFAPTDNNRISIESAMPSGHEDQLPYNGVFTINSHGSQKFPESCYFGIQTPQNPEDLTWNIVDAAGDIIAEGGPYSSGGFKVTPITFPEMGCYTVTVNDASGNGLDGGLYVFLDQGSNVLWTGKDFTDVAMAELAYDITIDIPLSEMAEQVSIYPNPATQNATIDFSLNTASNVKIDVYDMLGRNAFNLFEGEMNSGSQSIQLDANNLEEGIYFVKFEINGEAFTKKFSVK